MKVLLLRTSLDITQRWAVGRVPTAGETVHLPVVFDPRSGSPQPYAPASGLAGSLKSHLGARLGEFWLGPEPPGWEEAGGKSPRVISRLALRGTVMPRKVAEQAGTIHTRSATSIDRERGAARPGGLRTEQWNRPGQLGLAMECENADDLSEEAIDELLEALARWTPVVGRSASTGMGAAEVKSVDYLIVDLSDGEHFRWWLTERAKWLRYLDTEPPVDVQHRSGAGGTAPARWTREVTWEVREPLHIGTGDSEGAATQHGEASILPILKVDGKPVIPGSSWKGVVRGRCATILALLEVEHRDEIIAAMFGSSQNGRGLLSFTETVIESSGAGEPLVNTRTHVAIDRFTGGARDGALFTVEYVREGTALTLLISADDEPPEAVLGLLDHVFWDVNEGIIGIGGMVTRGYGGLSLTGASLRRPQPIDVDALVHFVTSGDQAEEVSA
jgi:CRISPR/Cas system CSM-associated protein Csm3 (group 7 of RAMP superfamily)